MENLWLKCNGIQHIKKLSQTAWRLVANDDETLIAQLVDTDSERELLNDMMDVSFKESTFIHSFHPLLSEPFRDPPLRYSSRFGRQHEPGIWYGSLHIHAAMAEKAFYLLSFIRASKINLSKKLFTAFAVNIKSIHGIDLMLPPFLKHKKDISSPVSYAISQPLGSAMRQAKVEVVCYESARDSGQGINVALFTPKAFPSKLPIHDSLQSWSCIADGEKVEFVRNATLARDFKQFLAANFMVQGKFPLLLF